MEVNLLTIIMTLLGFLLAIIVVVAVIFINIKFPEVFKNVKKISFLGLATVEFEKQLSKLSVKYSANIDSLPSNIEINEIFNIEISASRKRIDVEAIAKRIAIEYEMIRLASDKSDKRTAEMATKASGLRLLGLAILPYREKFAISSSAGERLVAIMSLQVLPCSIYLNWLYNCVVHERGFVQYNALLALRSYIKSITLTDDPAVDEIMKKIGAISIAWEPCSDRQKLYEELFKMHKEKLKTLKKIEAALHENL